MFRNVFPPAPASLLEFLPPAETYNPALWSGLHYRMIGPERGGRVTTVTGVPSQPYTFYMGSTGGGVWETTDAGRTWVTVSRGPIPLGSLGASECSPSRSILRLSGPGSPQSPQPAGTATGP